jgi:hypothetical protein
MQEIRNRLPLCGTGPLIAAARHHPPNVGAELGCALDQASRSSKHERNCPSLMLHRLTLVLISPDRS